MNRTRAIPVVLFAFLAGLSTSYLLAQDKPQATRDQAQELCGGPVGRLRRTELYPDGSLSGFKAAMDAHSAWYRNAGYTDNKVTALRVLKTDGGNMSIDPSVVYSLHIDPPGVAWSSDQAGWDAFVAQYDANGRVVATVTVCLDEVAAALKQESLGNAE